MNTLERRTKHNRRHWSGEQKREHVEENKTQQKEQVGAK